MMKNKLRLFRRDTVRELRWLDFDNHIYDEVWHRYYVLFGIFKFELTFKEVNNLSHADNRAKRPTSGFKKSG